MPNPAGKTVAWRRPPRKRVLAIRDRLRELYGRPVNEPHGQPIAELVRTVLSQNTNDRNRDVAYEGLRAACPTWEEVRDAPQAKVIDAIRSGGLADTKGPRIQAILAAIGDPPDLDWLESAPREEALPYLVALPGVGRKTAACVLLFAFNRPEIPVDVHVKRVGERLGLFRPGASFDEAHDEMLNIARYSAAASPPDLSVPAANATGDDQIDSYELHMNLISHGRQVCRPRPRCQECALRRMCPWWRAGGPGSSG